MVCHGKACHRTSCDDKKESVRRRPLRSQQHLYGFADVRAVKEMLEVGFGVVVVAFFYDLVPLKRQSTLCKITKTSMSALRIRGWVLAQDEVSVLL